MLTTRDILTDLTALKDEARIQLHLLSMDARDRWQELQKELSTLEQTLNKTGENANAAGLTAGRNLIQSARRFLKDHTINVM